MEEKRPISKVDEYLKKGYLSMEEREELGLYPYSPMKPMGNFSDNIDRGT